MITSEKNVYCSKIIGNIKHTLEKQIQEKKNVTDRVSGKNEENAGR